MIKEQIEKLRKDLARILSPELQAMASKAEPSRSARKARPAAVKAPGQAAELSKMTFTVSEAAKAAISKKAKARWGKVKAAKQKQQQ
jgi:hypothetical protein